MLHKAKVDEVLTLQDELGDTPLFLCYEFDHERIQLQKAFPDAPAVYSATTDAAGTRIFNEWNQGKHPVLIGQTQSLSHGLNLQAVKAAVIYFSLTWDFDAFDQFRRRVWRQGQKYPVKVFYILCEDSIDVIQFLGLQSKDSDQNKMFNALQGHYLLTQKGTEKMATKKAAQLAKKRRKKATSKKRATKKKVAKKVARKKAPAKKRTVKKKAAKKKVTKRAGGLAKGQHDPKLNRDADGLRKGSTQAGMIRLMRRKTGVTIAQAEKALDTSNGSFRVNVNLLKKKGFKITNDEGVYRCGK